MTKPSADGRIPSLDGLRAFSIAGVVISHAFFKYGLAHWDHTWVRIVRNLGPLGVGVFFGISGYLITSLLVREREKTGDISLPEFYIRRAFRILPPFWAFVAVMALVGAPVAAVGYRNALFFLTDYLPAGWWLGHSWSLSVEEQFYLVWPALMVIAGLRAPLVALALLLASPMIRVLHAHWNPEADIGSMGHTRIDALMVGCYLALARARLQGTLPYRIAKSGYAAAAAAAILIVGSPLLTIRYEGHWAFPFGMSLEALSVGVILAWAVERPQGPMGWFLNWWPVARLGVLSYSLYLWQQPFFAGELWNSWIGKFPLNVIAPLVCAALSYRFVEKPAMRLRDRVIAWRRERLAAEAAPLGDG